MKKTRRRKQVLINEIEIAPDPQQVIRYLGYSEGARPNPRVLRRVKKFLSSLPPQRPKAIYSRYPVDSCTRGSLVLQGGGRFTGRIGEFMGPGIEQVAVFVTTAGSKVTESSEEAFQSGETLEGLCWDALGSHLADAAVQAVLDKVMREVPTDRMTTLPFSPGYCGIPLQQQRTVFRLIDAQRVGVELLSSCFMSPVKSISGLIGIGPVEEVFSRGNPCDHCGRNDCRMSRRAT